MRNSGALLRSHPASRSNGRRSLGPSGTLSLHCCFDEVCCDSFTVCSVSVTQPHLMQDPQLFQGAAPLPAKLPWLQQLPSLMPPHLEAGFLLEQAHAALALLSVLQTAASV